MSKELGDYLREDIEQHGQPEDWVSAAETVQRAILALGIDRQTKYGPGNIAQRGELGVLIRAGDKLERAWNMLRTGLTDEQETIVDSFGDLANYGIYGVMLQMGWWHLPLREETAPEVQER